MGKITSLIRRAPKRFSAAALMIAAAIIVPATLFAWGPSRQTFTTAKPADYVTFNSIVDNPAHGDERNFMQVREASQPNSAYADSVSLTPGKEYVVYMYYHNNAAANLKLTAVGSYAKAEIPAVVAKGSTGTKAVGYVGASNAKPTQVWDDISFKNSSAGDIALRFVPGSATIHSKGAVNGKTMSDNIITSGAALGYNALDGKVPGCDQYAGYVTFRIKADQPNFTIKKEVRASSTSAWTETVSSKNGATVDYQLQYKNTGTTQQNNVVIKDVLPKGLDYVAGSTYLVNGSNPSPKKVSDNIVTAGGLNIGHYAPGAGAYIKLSAKVNTKALTTCGTVSLKNVASANTANGSKSDDATVKVTKECPPPVKKIQVCELSTKKIITIDEKNFDSKKHSKNLKDCEVKKITVCELATKKIVTIDEKNFDSKKHSKNLNDCVEKKIVVCELSTKKIITINEKNFDSKKHTKDLNKCKEEGKIAVCELATKKIISIKASEFDSKKHSKNLNDCVEKKIVVCEVATKSIITIDEKNFDSTKHSKNLDDCKEIPEVPETPETPETPTELPTTGAGENIVALIGLGSLIAAIGYYIASRRALV